MTTASKNSNSSRRFNPSRKETEEMVPTLLRLPDLCPPTISEETVAEQSSTSDESEINDEPSMPEMLDVATEAPAISGTQPSVTRLPNLTPPQNPASPPATSVPAPVIRETTITEPTESTQEPSCDESSETFGSRALAVVGSRNTLLVLLAVLACWAVFAPRRNPNAQQNSEVLKAKEPEADRSAAKKNDPSSFGSIASDKVDSRPMKPSGIRNATDSLAVGESTPSKLNKSQAETGLSMTASKPNTPKHSVNKTTLGLPSATNAVGGVPGRTSLVQSQLASSTMQHDVGDATPFDSVPFHLEETTDSASSVRESPVTSATGADMTVDALAENYAAALPSETPAEQSADGDTTTDESTAFVGEPIDSDGTPETTPSADEAASAAPVPLQTGTPGPILNWIDYLPPMPSEIGEEASIPETIEPTNPGLATPTVGEQAIGGNEFPATQSPSTPDFRFALPGDGPETTVGNQSPATSDQPDARVAAPTIYPDFNLRR